VLASTLRSLHSPHVQPPGLAVGLWPRLGVPADADACGAWAIVPGRANGTDAADAPPQVYGGPGRKSTPCRIAGRVAAPTGDGLRHAQVLVVWRHFVRHRRRVSPGRRVPPPCIPIATGAEATGPSPPIEPAASAAQHPTACKLLVVPFSIDEPPAYYVRYVVAPPPDALAATAQRVPCRGLRPCDIAQACCSESVTPGVCRGPTARARRGPTARAC